MYLSLIHLNPASAEVQRDLRDAHQLHCTIMKAFPDVGNAGTKARTQFAVLHRLEFNHKNGWKLYVQSGVKPEWDVLPKGYAKENIAKTKSIDTAYNSLQPGQRLRFCLRANVTKKIDTKSDPGGKKRNGRRVPLRQIDEQIEWLLRKAGDHGFELQQVIVAGTGSAELVKSYSTNRTFQGVLYEGILKVKDSQQFVGALSTGIGPGKAYGFGLLSIAPC